MAGHAKGRVRCIGTRRDGLQCERMSQQGTKTCGSHLGSTSRARTEAIVRTVEGKGLLAYSDIKPVHDTLGTLAALVGELVSLKDEARAAVARLTDIRYEHDKSGEQMRGEVELYERILTATGRLLVDIARLNLEDRMVRLEEKRADMVLAAFDGALAHAALAAPLQQEIGVDFRRRLRVVAGGSA